MAAIVARAKTEWLRLITGWRKFRQNKRFVRTVKQESMTRSLTRNEARLVFQVQRDRWLFVPFSFLALFKVLVGRENVFYAFQQLLPSTCVEGDLKRDLDRRLLGIRLELSHRLDVTMTKTKLLKPSDLIDVTSIVSVADRLPGHFELNVIHRPMLRFMCMYMNLYSRGPPFILRNRLRRLRDRLSVDDELISRAGVSSLSDTELADALNERGMRADVSRTVGEALLKEWLHLSLKLSLPTYLLFITRPVLLPKIKPAFKNTLISDQK